jgi:hypothetical protein
MLPFVLPAAVAGVGLGLGWWGLRRRGLDRWLPSYIRQTGRRRARLPGEPTHLLLCVADHFEPQLGKAPPAVADRRVERWVQEYPRLFGDFRDSDGRPPRHSFFFPEEEYEPAHLDALAGLCRAGFGEVEVHLHHDNDTAAGLREKLVGFKQTLAERHGLLATNRTTGELTYGFIHGNWALDNSHPHGRWCGVANELDVLRETGCYADFTLPSAPEPMQTRKINSIYYARGVPGRSKSHDTGTDVGTGLTPAGALMLIQGPLLLNWVTRKWGVLPRIENACLQGNQPPTPDRLDLWLKARVQVPTRPDWFFVKLHTHGASEANQPVLLGEPMIRLHRELARRAAADPQFRYHYVTAREMYNLARAAEAGWQGSVDEARDFELVWNGPATRPDRPTSLVSVGV